MKDIGKRLQTARKRAGFESCYQGAIQTGLPLSSLHDYETERSYPGAEALHSLCKGYAISADYLLGLSPLTEAWPRS